MRYLFNHIKIILLLAILAKAGIVMGQDKQISIEKGARTFTASSNADQYEWYVDGELQPGITIDKFTNNWKIKNNLKIDTFELSAIPFKEGCAGEAFIVQLIVKDTVTNGDYQLVFTSKSPLLACPSSNAKPNATQTIVEVEFRYYGDLKNPSSFVLAENQEYAIKYSIDNGDPVSKVLNKSQTSFAIDVKNLTPGIHHLKLLKLAYGKGFREQVDYTNASKQPMIDIKVRPAPMIQEIEIVED